MQKKTKPRELYPFPLFTQAPAAVAEDNNSNNVNSLLKLIPKMEQHLQLPSEQQQQGVAAAVVGGEFEAEANDDNNEDDSRFEVPTDVAAVVAAADAINLAPSTNATNYGDGSSPASFLSSDLAVENRIK